MRLSCAAVKVALRPPPAAAAAAVRALVARLLARLQAELLDEAMRANAVLAQDVSVSRPCHDTHIRAKTRVFVGCVACAAACFLVLMCGGWGCAQPGDVDSFVEWLASLDAIDARQVPHPLFRQTFQTRGRR